MDTFGEGIDALGRIAGYYSDISGDHGFQYDPANSVTPFIYPLDASGANATYAYGINSQNTVIGYYSAPSGQSFSFSYNGGTWQMPIMVPGSYSTRAVGIHDAEIMGFYSSSQTSLVEHGFILSTDGWTFIDNPQAYGTIIYGKNAANQIVGACKDLKGKYHGFLYAGNTFITIEPPEATQSWAKSINNRGQIVGQYSDSQGSYHGFLATPIK